MSGFFSQIKGETFSKRRLQVYLPYFCLEHGCDFQKCIGHLTPMEMVYMTRMQNGKVESFCWTFIYALWRAHLLWFSIICCRKQSVHSECLISNSAPFFFPSTFLPFFLLPSLFFLFNFSCFLTSDEDNLRSLQNLAFSPVLKMKEVFSGCRPKGGGVAGETYCIKATTPFLLFFSSSSQFQAL